MKFKVVWAKDMPRYGKNANEYVGNELEDFIYDEQIHDGWANDIKCCSINGFFVDCDGNLVIADSYGNYTYLPDELFKVVEVGE